MQSNGSVHALFEIGYVMSSRNECDCADFVQRARNTASSAKVNGAIDWRKGS